VSPQIQSNAHLSLEHIAMLLIPPRSAKANRGKVGKYYGERIFSFADYTCFKERGKKKTESFS